MDRVISNSWLSLDYLYERFPALADYAVNNFQFLTAVWNIFLIFIPLFFYLLLKRYWFKTRLVLWRQKFWGFILFIFWLLFFPNTAYLITDVRHLLNYCPVDSVDKVCLYNAWMIIFFFSYAAIGWAAFYYLLKMMSGLISEIFGELRSKIFIVLLIPLTALGVLFGLISRFNSWDIFLLPDELARVSLLYFTSFYYFINWLYFSIFLYLLYWAGDAIFMRIKR